MKQSSSQNDSEANLSNEHGASMTHFTSDEEGLGQEGVDMDTPIKKNPATSLGMDMSTSVYQLKKMVEFSDE
jgi:hypothetical protein